MNLNEAEKRMVYQIESTNQGAALNEIYMTWRYAPDKTMKDTAESLLRKLRPLSEKECMDVIRDVQKNYRLPGKARTIGEMLAEARQQSGAQKLAGHDIMALERFDPDTRHMIVFDVLSHESPIPCRSGLSAYGQRKRPSRSQRSRKNWQNRDCRGQTNESVLGAFYASQALFQ